LANLKKEILIYRKKKGEHKKHTMQSEIKKMVSNRPDLPPNLQ